MKNFKLIVIIAFAGLIAINLTGCKKKCKNDPPQARIINNGSAVASVQIKTSEGNTVNINNVDPGTSSSYASYTAGDITFTITVNKNNYVKAVNLGNCYDYDIAIDGNNEITATTIGRN